MAISAPGLHLRKRARARRKLLFGIATLPLLDVMAAIVVVMLGWFDSPPT